MLFFLDIISFVVYTTSLEKRDIMECSIEKFSEYLKKQSESLLDNITTVVNLDRSLNQDPQAHIATENSLKETIYKIQRRVKPFDQMLQEAMFLDELINVLKKMRDQSFKDNGIIQDFDHISLYLLRAPLKGKEQCEIIMSFIKNNIENEILSLDEHMAIIDIDRLEEKGISSKDILEIIKGDNAFRILYTEDDKLSKKELIMKQELKNTYEEYQRAHSINFIKCHENIKKHYLDQLDSYQKEDINIIRKSLDSLDVPKELCSIIYSTLNHNLSKREKNKSKNVSICLDLKLDGNSSYLSDKEYKKLRKQIDPFLDLYTMESKRPLNEDERIYCAHLLLKMKEEKSLIKTFFFKTEKKPNNPIGLYNHSYDKLKFYEKELGFSESLEAVQDYLGEIFLADNETYQYFKQGIQEEMKKMMAKIPMDYAYEFSKASSYQEKQKEMKKK